MICIVLKKKFVQKFQDLVPKFLSTKSASSSFSTETESHVLSLQVVLDKSYEGRSEGWVTCSRLPKSLGELNIKHILPTILLHTSFYRMKSFYW